jgi:uncharacterized membrane protein
MDEDGWLSWSAVAAYIAFGVVCDATFALLNAYPVPWLPLRAFLLRHGAELFAVGQILFSFAALLCLLRRDRRAASLWALALTAAVTLAAEASSVFTGLPFGRYTYRELIGPRIFGAVPALVPISWITIAIPAFAIAQRAFPQPEKVWPRRLLGSGLMLLWDFSVDPLMAHYYDFWTWKTPGLYYGIPASNFAGWLGLGVVVMGLLDWIRPDLSEQGPLFVYYAATLLMTLGMAALGGMAPAAILTAAGIVLAAYIWRQTAPAPSWTYLTSISNPECAACAPAGRR